MSRINHDKVCRKKKRNLLNSVVFAAVALSLLKLPINWSLRLMAKVLWNDMLPWSICSTTDHAWVTNSLIIFAGSECVNCRLSGNDDDDDDEDDDCELDSENER